MSRVSAYESDEEFDDTRMETPRALRSLPSSNISDYRYQVQTSVQPLQQYAGRKLRDDTPIGKKLISDDNNLAHTTSTGVPDNRPLRGIPKASSIGQPSSPPSHLKIRPLNWDKRQKDQGNSTRISRDGSASSKIAESTRQIDSNLKAGSIPSISSSHSLSKVPREHHKDGKVDGISFQEENKDKDKGIIRNPSLSENSETSNARTSAQHEESDEISRAILLERINQTLDSIKRPSPTVSPRKSSPLKKVYTVEDSDSEEELEKKWRTLGRHHDSAKSEDRNMSEDNHNEAFEEDIQKYQSIDERRYERIEDGQGAERIDERRYEIEVNTQSGVEHEGRFNGVHERRFGEERFEKGTNGERTTSAHNRFDPNDRLAGINNNYEKEDRSEASKRDYNDEDVFSDSHRNHRRLSSNIEEGRDIKRRRRSSAFGNSRTPDVGNETLVNGGSNSGKESVTDKVQARNAEYPVETIYKHKTFTANSHPQASPFLPAPSSPAAKRFFSSPDRLKDTFKISPMDKSTPMEKNRKEESYYHSADEDLDKPTLQPPFEIRKAKKKMQRESPKERSPRIPPMDIPQTGSPSMGHRISYKYDINDGGVFPPTSNNAYNTKRETPATTFKSQFQGDQQERKTSSKDEKLQSQGATNNPFFEPSEHWSAGDWDKLNRVVSSPRITRTDAINSAVLMEQFGCSRRELAQRVDFLITFNKLQKKKQRSKRRK